MPTIQVVPGLSMIPLGIVNTYLLDTGELTVFDCGLPGSEKVILDAVRGLGKEPSDIRHIVLTHAHPDHIGGAAALKQATDATVYCHSADRAIVEAGKNFRPLTPSPGLMNAIMFRLFINPNTTVDPVVVDETINDGDELTFAGGMKAIQVPGHCLGQLALLWAEHGGVLMAADVCGNTSGMKLSLGYEDLEEGKRSLQKLGKLDFQVACFGHGKPILKDAAAQFRQKWG